MLMDPSASQTTRALERKKGWIWREHSKVLWEFIKVLSTKPAGIIQQLKVSVYSSFMSETQNTADPNKRKHTVFSLTVTFGF